MKLKLLTIVAITIPAFTAFAGNENIDKARVDVEDIFANSIKDVDFIRANFKLCTPGGLFSKTIDGKVDGMISEYRNEALQNHNKLAAAFDTLKAGEMLSPSQRASLLKNLNKEIDGIIAKTAEYSANIKSKPDMEKLVSETLRGNGAIGQAKNAEACKAKKLGTLYVKNKQRGIYQLPEKLRALKTVVAGEIEMSNSAKVASMPAKCAN